MLRPHIFMQTKSNFFKPRISWYHFQMLLSPAWNFVQNYVESFWLICLAERDNSLEALESQVKHSFEKYMQIFVFFFFDFAMM